VLVIGAGGLGAPALLGLAATGVRRITIFDPDRVERTNLHRQILYTEADLGEPKAIVARRRLLDRFPELEIAAEPIAFGATTMARVAEHEVVLDGTDRFETKLAISDACVDLRIPYVFGGVIGFDGQVLGHRPGSACLRCLFEEAPPPGAAPTCEELGIVGPVAGIVAARQVEVALGLLSGDPRAVEALWVYDGRRDVARSVPLSRAEDCRGCGTARSARGWQGGSSPPGTPLEGLGAGVEELDLRHAVCPTSFIETRRALERLPEGGRLWVQLGSDESARSVPASALAAGYRVLVRLWDGRVHRLLLERPADEGARPTAAPRSG
jgi:adenylyltransferase/sulfurtransferase